MNPLETQTTAPLSNPTTYSPDKDSPFSPKGRFSRLSYLAWLFITGMLYSCALFLVAGVAGVAVMKAGVPSFDALLQTGLGYFALFLILAVVIAFTVISICISIRRIHDLDKSGWLWLLLIVPFINIIFGIYIMCAKGTEGENKYGPQRTTEQTEKLLGTVYAIFLALFIIAYGSITIWYINVMRNSDMHITTTEMNEDADSSLEQQLSDAEQAIEESADQIEQHADAIEESSESVDESAEAAVQAANDAAEAAEISSNHEENQR